MECNVGEKDRQLRIIAGLLIIIAGLLAHSWLGLLGLPLLASAYFRFCGAYKLLGITTKK